MVSYALQRLPAETTVARADMRVKFALLLLASSVIFVWNSILLQAAFLACVLGLMLSAGVTATTIRKLVLIVLPALVLITVIQGLWSPFGRTPVFTVPDGVPVLGSLHIFYVEGLLFGLVVCCRVLIPMLAFQLVFMTSEPNDIVLGLVRIGVPYRVAFLFSTTFRFVPLLFQELEGIKEAQRLRGIDIDDVGMVRKLVALGRMLVPLIMICLTKAQLMEIALQAKAFSGSADRTSLHPSREQLSPGEWLAIGTCFGLLAGAIACRVLYGLGGKVL
ncbi:energy-coupling factor transporter transmembrane component T family protein [Mesorhizobium sp. ES1-1]|uniref:energy-coupling factor transporter transmembrane component T family protein n=1 Tax=Mesorhizobium sp. ES1-1 TaxID=2876629 RepID=UPI001CCBF8D2|nr:energy-coupling factor transporter transmembrane component T [Mesorhizobium sp. ES1-1]MBZ9675488.1 energy-coupling factor transporter transmembrane protein EcfT [Mesorhizobium sp. ES1-1]